MHASAQAELARELDGFDPTTPIAEARTPPSSWYRRPELLALEERTVFRRSWLAAARADQVAASGSYVAGRMLGEPYVVLRDEAGALRALHNVCRHHGAEIASGEGRARALTCPYHAWTYDLCGRLLRAPRAQEHCRPGAAPVALPEIAATTFGPLVFLDLGGGAPALDRDLAPLAAHHSEGELARLVFACRRTYTLECNWKVFIENYLDGGYHVTHLHRGLAGQLDLESYRTELHGRLVLQLCASGGSGATGDFRERIGAGATYAWLHPNLMLNRYGPLLDVNVVLPLGPERCEVIFDYWIDPGAGGDASFLERSLAASERVQREDTAICESVQRGLASTSYGSGRYAAEVEAGLHHFHRLLAADLRAGQAT